MDDLFLSMRQKENQKLEEIEYAFLEPKWKLSIFKYNFLHLKSTYPMPLILDGEINKKTLNFLGKNKFWLEEEIEKKNLDISNIFYAFYKGKKIYLITKSEI